MKFSGIAIRGKNRGPPTCPRVVKQLRRYPSEPAKNYSDVTQSIFFHFFGPLVLGSGIGNSSLMSLVPSDVRGRIKLTFDRLEFRHERSSPCCVPKTFPENRDPCLVFASDFLRSRLARASHIHITCMIYHRPKVFLIKIHRLRGWNLPRKRSPQNKWKPSLNATKDSDANSVPATLS